MVVCRISESFYWEVINLCVVYCVIFECYLFGCEGNVNVCLLFYLYNV